ncbi:MAG: HAD hydrolase family protein [Candidatus Riflebacteria bacterium]
MNYQAILLTDLDGTLLNSQSRVSQRNYEIFAILAEKKIARVAATGRSLFSTRRVLPDDFPIDYLIFSSGAGILEWRSGKVMQASSLCPPEICSAAAFFLENRLDFSIHHPIPDTHKFHWYPSSSPHFDFLQRVELFRQFAHTGDFRQIDAATQLLAVTDDSTKLIPELKRRCSGLSVIRSTSPLNRSVDWIEVFPGSVSKGHAGDWLARELEIPVACSMSIGNDYNDIEMLQWAKHSFIMANGPEELRKRFTNAPHHDEDGFSAAVETWLCHCQL